jgi:hypothetical protein
MLIRVKTTAGERESADTPAVLVRQIILYGYDMFATSSLIDGLSELDHRNAPISGWITSPGFSHSKSHDRFQEWAEVGLFLKLWQAGVELFDELCRIDRNWLSLPYLRNPQKGTLSATATARWKHFHALCIFLTFELKTLVKL